MQAQTLNNVRLELLSRIADFVLNIRFTMGIKIIFPVSSFPRRPQKWKSRAVKMHKKVLASLTFNFYHLPSFAFANGSFVALRCHAYITIWMRSKEIMSSTSSLAIPSLTTSFWLYLSLSLASLLFFSFRLTCAKFFFVTSENWQHGWLHLPTIDYKTCILEKINNSVCITIYRNTFYTIFNIFQIARGSLLYLLKISIYHHLRPNREICYWHNRLLFHVL